MAKKPLSLDYIVLDIGNSDYKYALISQNQVLSIHRSSTLPRLAHYKVPVLGSSVVPKRQTKLDKNLMVHWIKPSDIPIIAPPNIGLDRLMALYAAKLLYQAKRVLTIDVGTFITLSVLDEHEFVGGYIIPGPQTMMASYGRGAQLPENQHWQNTLGLQTDTIDAMQAGTTETLSRAMTSLIKDIADQYPDILVVGTGGGAISLLSPIETVTVINPTLVLEGLNLLAQTKKLF